METLTTLAAFADVSRTHGRRPDAPRIIKPHAPILTLAIHLEIQPRTETDMLRINTHAHDDLNFRAQSGASQRRSCTIINSTARTMSFAVALSVIHHSIRVLPYQILQTTRQQYYNAKRVANASSG